MQNNLFTRLRAEANSIDDTAVVELRALLADAAEEVDRLKAQNEHMRGILEDARAALRHYAQGQAESDIEEIEIALSETPAQSLADIQARAVDSILKDLRSDIPDTNTARRVFQRLQLRVDVLRGKAKHGSDRGGSSHDREVLGQNNEGDTVTV